MIKINIKTKLLSEALLRFSKVAQEEIVSFVEDAIEKGNINSSTIIKIPLKEILYSKNNILDGLPFLYYGNLLNSRLPSDEIINNWDEKNDAFDESFIKNLLEQECSVSVRTDNSSGKSAMAIFGAATTNNITSIIMIFYLKNIKNIDSIENFTRHELQHLTQKMNNACVLYSEKLKKFKHPKNVKLINLNFKRSKNIKFGLGQQQTGIKKHKISNLKKYLGADIEYETYLSDLVYSFHRRLKKDFADDLLQDIKKHGPHATAIKYTKLLFSYLRHEQEYKSFNSVLEVIYKKRPREFPKDFINSLEKLLS